MKKTTSGFTIVELLIVIVVIAILAAISIVAYNGIQVRARDNIRYQDAKSILKALELYKADHGYYPSWTQNNNWVTQAATCGTSHTNGYSYSDATDGSWMKPLVDKGYISKVPKAPSQSCTNYYRYIATGDPNSYNCPSRTTKWFVLIIEGTESGWIPSDASNPQDGSPWKACPTVQAWWGGTTQWVFAREDT